MAKSKNTEILKISKTAKKRATKKTSDKKKEETSILVSDSKRNSFSVGIAKSNVNITHANMLSDPYVYSCIKVLSESIASTPIEIYDNNTNQKATDFYLYNLLKNDANEEMTIYEVLQWLTIDYYRYNYCIAVIPRDKETNQIIGIYPLPADMVSVYRDEYGTLNYVYGEMVFESSEVLVVRNFFDRGLFGTSMLNYQKDTLGVSKATEDFSATSFSKGLFPSGLVSVKDDTSLEELTQLKEKFREEFGGVQNAGNAIISAAIEDFKPFTIANDDAQMIESRKFNRSIIAGLFRVPAHLINDLEKATFSNIEHQDLSFVKHTLRPIAKNFEQRFRKGLLIDDERSRYSISFNFDAIARGDLVSRTSAICQQIQSGLRDINEARELFNLPPKKDGDIARANAALKPIQIENN